METRVIQLPDDRDLAWLDHNYEILLTVTTC